jgi:hypothetical protein
MKNLILFFSLILIFLSNSSCQKHSASCSIEPVRDTLFHIPEDMPPLKYYFNQDTKDCDIYSYGGGEIPFETLRECECACKN